MFKLLIGFVIVKVLLILFYCLVMGCLVVSMEFVMFVNFFINCENEVMCVIWDKGSVLVNELVVVIW